MNEIENQNESGSASSIAQEVHTALMKSGTRVWLGLPTPQELEKLKAERDDRILISMKNRAAERDGRFAKLKEGTRKVLQKESYE